MVTPEGKTTLYVLVLWREIKSEPDSSLSGGLPLAVKGTVIHITDTVLLTSPEIRKFELTLFLLITTYVVCSLFCLCN